jgi:RNA-binding protein 39
VYLRFGSTEGASAARLALHGRWFAGKMIAAEFQFVPVYDKHFGI